MPLLRQAVQKMSVYFPLTLLERVRESARLHRRSFNQEVLWLIEESLKRKGEQKHDEGV